MKLSDFLECANADIMVKYDDGYVKISAEICGELEYIFTTGFLNQYVYSVSIKDNCFEIVLDNNENY